MIHVVLHPLVVLHHPVVPHPLVVPHPPHHVVNDHVTRLFIPSLTDLYALPNHSVNNINKRGVYEHMLHFPAYV